MCRIDGCDETYLDCAIPLGANVDRCTDCGRSVVGEKTTTLEGKVHWENLPYEEWFAWDPATGAWADWENDPDEDTLEWRKPAGEPGTPLMGLYDAMDGCEDLPINLPREATDGAARVHVTCLHCRFAGAWLNAVCHGYIYDEICSEIIEHWDDDEVLRSLAFGKLVVWTRARWVRNGVMIDPSDLNKIVQAAIPYEYRPEVVKARWAERDRERMAG